MAAGGHRRVKRNIGVCAAREYRPRKEVYFRKKGETLIRAEPGRSTRRLKARLIEIESSILLRFDT